MSNDPPGTVWMTKEDESLSSVDSDLLRGNPNDQKPDAKSSRPQRASAGSRRPRREKEKDNMKAEKKDATDNNTNGKISKKEKEPKPRGNRRSATASMSSSNSRKKPKLESPETPPNGVSNASSVMGITAPQNPQVTNSPSVSATIPPVDHHQSHQSPFPPTSHHLHPQPQHPFPPYSNIHPPPAPYPTVQPYSQPGPQSQPSQPPPPQRTSGQNYDPIRSAFGTSSPAPPSAISPPARNISPRHTFRASASPAINSLIDPPSHTPQPLYSPIPHASPSHNFSNPSSPGGPTMAPAPTHHSQTTPSLSATSFSHNPISGSQHPPSSVVPPPPQTPHSYLHQTPYQTLQPQNQQLPQEQGPRHEFSKPAQPAQAQQQRPEQPAQPKNQHVSPPQSSTNVDMDTEKTQSSATESAALKNEKVPIAAPTSAAASPQPARTAKESQALPQGSGLITNALFGMGDISQSSESSETTPNIIVHVPLKGTGNKIINFARLAEEQYGFAALHPRLAAHQERLARVAAAGAALERNEKGRKGADAESADEDLSLDVDRDSELDGDVAMGGLGGTNGAGTEDGDGTKKRRKKVEEYDRDDPFVDDSELVWQEQAAASKDGFFVYSGPLVPEGEKVQVERADGTIKRGRGRGRGTGRSRAPPTTHQQVLAAATPVSLETGLPLRGPGSRGGTSRRPRGNKTARPAGDHEKQDRDRTGLSASAAPESRGRGGGVSRGGGSTSRGGKTPSMMELAPAAPKPNIAPAPPGPSPLAGPELIMKQ